ncbi:MAG: MFS transporter [Lentisphaeria bacterium]|nr:MFS transporter [Lentisphaeria bacterium]
MRIQLCPALMDWIVFLLLFAVLYGAGERGLSGLQCAWLGGGFQLAYLCSSFLVGMLLSRRNARALVLGSTVATTLLGVGCLVTTGFPGQLVCLALAGISLAVFFNAFQTFMRGETVPGGLARTVGRYTIAWSLGSSMGFLSSGFAYELGRFALSAVNTLVGIAVLVVLLTYRHRPHHEASADEHVEPSATGARPVNPAYVPVAWCMIFTAMFVQRPLQSFFPALCARAGVSALVVAWPLCLHMFLQGVWGYAVHRFGRWRYRRTPVAVVHGSAAALLWLLWLHPSFAVVAVGIVILGLYTGYAYFTAVFYCSNSGRRSFNIGVNECLVGLGSFAGLFVTEAWMKRTGSDAAMYAVCGTALLVSLLVQVALAGRPRTPRPALTPAT